MAGACGLRIASPLISYKKSGVRYFLFGALLSMFSFSRCVRCTRFRAFCTLWKVGYWHTCAPRSCVCWLFIRNAPCYLSGVSFEFVACHFFIRFILPLCNSLWYLATCPSQYSVLTLWRVRFGPFRGGWRILSRFIHD